MIIAGGGTGGHLFPGVAVAEAFLKRDQRNRVLFIITGKPVEEQVLGMYGFERRVIAVEGITGRGIVKGLKAALKIPLALMQSRTLLAAYDPQVVLGVGGYVAGPLVFALVSWISTCHRGARTRSRGLRIGSWDRSLIVSS